MCIGNVYKRQAFSRSVNVRSQIYRTALIGKKCCDVRCWMCDGEDSEDWGNSLLDRNQVGLIQEGFWPGYPLSIRPEYYASSGISRDSCDSFTGRRTMYIAISVLKPGSPRC